MWPIQSKVSRKMQKNAEKCRKRQKKAAHLSENDFCVLFFLLGVRAASADADAEYEKLNILLLLSRTNQCFYLLVQNKLRLLSRVLVSLHTDT